MNQDPVGSEYSVVNGSSKIMDPDPPQFFFKCMYTKKENQSNDKYFKKITHLASEFFILCFYFVDNSFKIVASGAI